MKVALVHDWLTGMRGGERCLEAFVSLYPTADIFTLVHVPGSTTPAIDARVKGVSFLHRVPRISKLYRFFLPLYPLAIRSIDLSGYDLVISLSHAAAKNVRIPKGATHVCYCFTPMRYIWDQAGSYFRGLSLLLLQPLLRYLRWWDTRGARGVAEFVGISSFISARIRKYYGRSSFVIPPPVRMADEICAELTEDEEAFFAQHPEPFFLCAGALVPYKRIEVAVDAFNGLGIPLWIVGKGPELERLRGRANMNVRFLGHVSEAFLWECYRRCRALVFPGIEDFGIVPVECLASGRPVIGIQAGGVAETVRGYPLGEASPSQSLAACTGVFIPKSGVGSARALAEAVRFFCEHETQFSSDIAREHARCFSYSQFFQNWQRMCGQIKIYPGVVPTQESEVNAIAFEGGQ
jgi:glycosyltransferase involved in cell wall biosynthesis